MTLIERSYSSKIFWPKPLLSLENDGGLLVVVTSWGKPEHGQLVIDEIVKYMTAAKGDVEVTSPFEFMTCYSDLTNHLRISLQIANDILYRGVNRSEYASGVEVLVLAQEDSHVSWAQVGSPHILLHRQNRSIAPLAIQYDHSFEMTIRGGWCPPLASRLLGVEPVCPLSCGEIMIKPEDQLILLSASQIPQALWSWNSGSVDLAKVTSEMVRQDGDQHFWLGLVQNFQRFNL